MGAAVAPRVEGLPADRRLTLQVRQRLPRGSLAGAAEAGRVPPRAGLGQAWLRLGTFRSRGNGAAVLPAFRVESSGTYVLRVVVAGRYWYLKVRCVA